MAVFPNSGIALQPPQYWGQYMPAQDTPEWADYAAWESRQPWAQPAGQAPSTFTGPDGGQWSAAGSQRMADMTTGDYYANMFNNRLQQAGRDPNGPDAKMFLLAMNSRQQIRPEEFTNAYMAHDANGNPILADPLVSLFERLGVRPPEYTAPVPGDKVPNTMPPGLSLDDQLKWVKEHVGTGSWSLDADGNWVKNDTTPRPHIEPPGLGQPPSRVGIVPGDTVDPDQIRNLAPTDTKTRPGGGDNTAPVTIYDQGGPAANMDAFGPLVFNQQNATPEQWQNFTNWVKAHQKPVMPAANQGRQMSGYGF